MTNKRYQTKGNRRLTSDRIVPGVIFYLACIETILIQNPRS